MVRDLLLVVSWMGYVILKLVMWTTGFISLRGQWEIQYFLKGKQGIFLPSHFYLKWFMSFFSAFIWSKFCSSKLVHIPKETNEIENWFVNSF